MLGDGQNEDDSYDTTMITEMTTMMPDISTTIEPVNSSTKDTSFSMTTSLIAITTTAPNKQTERVLTTKMTTTSSTTPKNQSTMPTFPKKRIQAKITTSNPSVTPKLKSTKSIFSSEIDKSIKRIIISKESTNMNQSHLIPQANESFFISLSIVLVGCGMVVCLVGYFISKYSNKWNQYNSQSIEYKSNYYSKRMEEPLVDDDAFASNDYINGACIIEERPLDNLRNGNVVAARPTSQIHFKSHKLAKIRRPTTHKKHIEQYSDEQCLTEDGDEFIDFLPQAN